MFVSDRIVPTHGGANVGGTLTMHGVSRSVMLRARLLLAPRTVGTTIGVAFSAQLSVSRKDFGIAGTNTFNPDYNPGHNMLSDSVEILLEIDAIREGYTDRRLGGGTPPGVADTVNRVLRARGMDAAIDTYRLLKANQAAAFRFTAGQLDVIGHQLAERGQVGDVVKILTYNAELFGDTPGVLESLGNAQLMANDAGRGAGDLPTGVGEVSQQHDRTGDGAPSGSEAMMASVCEDHSNAGLPVTQRMRLTALVCLVGLGVAPRVVYPQWPPTKVQNVKVLPPRHVIRSLVDTMAAFTRALGVRCTYCHVGSEASDLSAYDFVSDSLSSKRKAREMLRMVLAINHDYLAQLPGATRSADRRHVRDVSPRHYAASAVAAGASHRV